MNTSAEVREVMENATELVLRVVIQYGRAPFNKIAELELWKRRHPELVCKPWQGEAATGRWYWKARSTRGSCLHQHQSKAAAQRCCDQCNRPTSNAGTPQGAYDHAAGYPT